MRAVNLLPVEPKRTRKAPGAVAQIGLVAPFVVAGLLAAGFLLAKTQENSKRSTLQALEEELAAIPSPTPPPPVNTALAAERSLRISTLSATLQNRIVWDRVLRQVSAVLPGDVWLTTLSASTQVPPASVAAPVPAPAGGTTTTGTTTTTTTTSTTTTTGTTTTPAPPTPVVLTAGPLGLSGYTYSQEGVARLLSRLQVVPSLEGVKLVSSSSTLVAGQAVVAFSISAGVRAQETG